MDWKIELVLMPVTDIDRAKRFYESIGFITDHDRTVSDAIRFVQMTPPGSGCSIAFGRGISEMAPGSLRALQVVVSDIHLARKQLVAAGVEVGEVEVLDWGSFVHFADPDGNTWAVQQLPAYARPAADHA